MGIKDGLLRGVARQLAGPSGSAGRFVGRALNRGNREIIAAAVDGAGLASGEVAADIGFGGGAGLGLLLERVGPSGVIHGVEISSTMLSQARRRYRSELGEGRLRLHEAPMTAVPLPEASLDAVVSTNTIYFVSDLGGAMTQVARVLRPGGRLALGIGDPDAMAGLPFTRHGFTLRPVTEVAARVAGAGLAIVEDRRVGEGERPFHLIVAERAG